MNEGPSDQLTRRSSVPTQSIDYIRIFPGIGIMRVGNSPEYFIGPEAPGVVPDPGNGQYKDASGRVKRQASRFRVYGYVNGQSDPVMEITRDVAEVTWTVEMANMKAANYAFQGKYAFDPSRLRNANIQPDLPVEQRDKLIIAPPAQSIVGPSAGPIRLEGNIFEGVGPNGDGTGLTLPAELDFEVGGSPTRPEDPFGCVPNPNGIPVTYQGVENVCIGILHTDSDGRLVVVPGAGTSASVTTPKVAISKVATPQGQSPSPDPEINGNSYFNNPGWFDDTGDGRISATVRFADGTTLSTEGNHHHGDAWVVSTPPKYAPASMPVVSLYDVMLDVFPDAQPHRGEGCNFYRDIYPTFTRVVDYAWLNAAAFSAAGAHGPSNSGQTFGDLVNPFLLDLLSQATAEGQGLRRNIFAKIRPPWPPSSGASNYDPCQPWDSAQASHPVTDHMMPRLYGDGGSPAENTFNQTNYPQQWLSLTPHQYARFQQWSEGHFVTGTEPGTPPSFENIPLAQQPNALDQAALEPCVGGGFHPGIELTYNMQCSTAYDAPFRIAAGTRPGSLSGYMSIPWQGDFWSCNTHWWPGNRPDIWVDYVAAGKTRSPFEWFSGQGIPPAEDPGYQTMVHVWHLLGFVVPDGDPPVRVDGQRVLKQVERDASLGPGTVAVIPPPGSNS